MLNRIKKNESGFTFAEVVVSIGIISVIMLMFGLMLLSSANLQKQIITTQNIDSLLAFETEQVNSIRWDNIMNKPTPYAVCDIDGVRFSTQSIDQGPNIVSLDGTKASITRTATWYSSGLPVECTATNKNLFDAKLVTITASWLEDGETKTKTVTVLRSRWAEAPLDAVAAPEQGSGISLTYADSLGNPSLWGAAYNYLGTEVDPCQATTNNATSLNLTFTNSNAICGIEVQGLEIGKLYTIAAEITVAANSSALTLSNGDGANFTGIATPTSGTTILTHTFYADSTATRVGFKIPESQDYVTGTSALVSNFKVYKN